MSTLRSSVESDTRAGNAESRTADVDERASLFESHGAYVMRGLRYLGVHTRDVPDVTQEVFVVAFRRQPTDLEVSGERAWLYAICRRMAANYRRQHRHKTVLRDDLSERGTPPTQEQELQRANDRVRLREALQAIDEPLREVFVLHAIEELPMSEVAAILGWPLQTGYSRYRAACRDLRLQLGESGK